MALLGRKFSGACHSLIHPLICDIRYTVRTWKEVTWVASSFHALLYSPPAPLWPTPNQPNARLRSEYFHVVVTTNIRENRIP
jgi:hypothetical protein